MDNNIVIINENVSLNRRQTQIILLQSKCGQNIDHVFPPAHIIYLNIIYARIAVLDSLRLKDA